ncbi:MAG: ParB/RepB/Spo0J family partition protein [Campylobacterota bacterium]|nr:ParB/RepB/Spo0J family partition protein [Campylobacterota bacterium]
MGKKSSISLGRGLGELLGEMEAAYDSDVPKQYKVVEIPTSQISPNPYQPRKSFDEKSLQELSESIKENGLLQPIVVVEDIDGYVLIAGERRLRATKLAKIKRIKAIISDVDQDKMREHALLENIQRDELNAIELADAYAELLEVHQLTHDELSQMIHKSRTHITNTLRLLQLSKRAKDALIAKKISAGHAKVLITLDEKEQTLMIDSIIGQKLSVRDVENLIKIKKNSEQKIDLKDEKNEKNELDFSQLEDFLKSNKCKISVNSNKISVEFVTQSDINSFLELISH